MAERAGSQLPEVPANVEAVTGQFVNEQGLTLRTFQFGLRGAHRKGVVWLCHGYGAHTVFEWFRPSSPGGRHDQWQGSVIQGLVDAGYLVSTLDHQGHGLSEGIDGLQCFVQRFDDLPEESTEYICDVLLKTPKLRALPLFLFGISMGGATAVRMAQSNPELYRGVVLYSPMLCLEQMKEKPFMLCIKNKELLPIAGLLNHLFPAAALIAPARNTVHPESQEEMDEDELTYSGSVRVGTSLAFEEVTREFMSGGLKEMRTPFVTFHCAADTFTDPLGSKSLLELASADDKSFVEVGPGRDLNLNMWHALTVEPGCDVVFAYALEWIQKRT